MSHVHRRVRLPVGHARAAGPSDNRVALSYGLFGLFALGCIVVAFSAEESGLRFLMAGTAVFMILSLWFIAVLQRGRSRGFVGFSSTGPLTFRPVGAFYGLQLAMAIVGIVAGTGTLVIDPSMGRGQGAFWIGAFAVGSAIWFITQLISFRLPAGLCVSEVGLIGVRGVGRRAFHWDELVVATAEVEGREVALGVTDAHGLVANVGASYYLGSDPVAVAMIINHFLDYPEDRHLLNDPSAAIRRVEQGLSGQAEVRENTEGAQRKTPSASATAATYASRDVNDGASASRETPDHLPEKAGSTQAVTQGKRPLVEWPPERGWWWRWPLTLIVAVCWAFAFFSLVMVGSGEPAWFGLVFYVVLATAGTFLLRWHRGVRNRDS